MNEYALALVETSERVVPQWVESCVTATYARHGEPVPEDVAERARQAGKHAGREVGARMRALLERDIDEQAGNPMTILRSAVEYPTQILLAAGVPPVERDDFAARQFPGDHYDLTPANFGDVHPDLVDPGIAWGAAKAYEHIARHGGSRQ